MDISPIAWDYSTLKSSSDKKQYMIRTSCFPKNNVLKDIYDCISKTMEENPEYQQVYFDDQDCIDFIVDEYPEYFQDYMDLIPGAYKADLFRLLFLHKYGGVYNDCSHTYLIPVKDLVDPKRIVLVNDLDNQGFYNAFMACPANCPLIKKIIDVVIGEIRNRNYGNSWLDVTGPHTLRKAVLEYYSLPVDFSFRNIQEYEDVRLYQLLTQKHVYQGDNHIIKIKFDNYDEKVYYNVGKIHYSESWRTRKVFSDKPRIVWNYLTLKSNYLPVEGIPKYMIRTARFDSPPKEMLRVVLRTHLDNPEYQQVYFSDSDCRSFISDFFSDYLPEYDCLRPGAYKADLFRILLLYEYGGVYNDSTHQYLVPVHELITKDLILTLDRWNYGVFNSFMASIPNHPVISNFISSIITNIRNRDYGKCPLDITGPTALKYSLLQYLELPPNTNIRDVSKIRDFFDYEHKQEGTHIKDKSGRLVIKSKIQDYDRIMYKGIPKYYEYWGKREVFI